MKQALQLRTTQTLAITPQLQQSLRLLQLSALELEQEIAQAAETNPFLEQEDGASEETPGEISLDDLAGAEGRVPSSSAAGASDEDAGAYTPAPVSLHEQLHEQVHASALAGRDRLLAELVVEGLDEDGYLRQSFEELAALLPREMEASPDELAIALRFVQSFEPAGVGARSARECLALQLARLPAGTPGHALACAIVADHLPLLAAHDTKELLNVLECDEEALRRANALITGLDPRPGRRFGHDETRYVVPDVIVREQDGRWVATINAHVLPRIRVNELYVRIFHRARESGGAPLAQQLQEARWLVRNVQQRFQTIQRVAQAIVDRQGRFLEFGDVAMKPLLQRDIARTLGMHESTVSRAAKGKYMATPRGLVEFKRFFGSHVVAEGGHAHSSTAVRALIRYIIESEDAGSPLSDIKVMRKLRERGVEVARRTVTKYRDAMHIPPVEARRMAQHP